MEVQTELTWINGSKPVMFSSVIKKPNTGNQLSQSATISVQTDNIINSSINSNPSNKKPEKNPNNKENVEKKSVSKDGVKKLVLKTFNSRPPKGSEDLVTQNRFHALSESEDNDVELPSPNSNRGGGNRRNGSRTPVKPP